MSDSPDTEKPDSNSPIEFRFTRRYALAATGLATAVAASSSMFAVTYHTPPEETPRLNRNRSV